MTVYESLSVAIGFTTLIVILVFSILTLVKKK